jgi:hypothetical protein
MIRLRACLLGVGLALGVLTSAASAGASGLPHFGHVTCHNGNLKQGVYASLRVTGVCTVPTGAIVRVRNDVHVAPGATLNAITQSTFNVRGDVIVRRHAVIGLGCNDEVGCASSTDDHIGGTLQSWKAAAVVIEQETIGGDVLIRRGGGSMDCSSTALFGGPYFSTIHDSVIGGNVVFRAVHSCWFGLIRSTIGGDVHIARNRMGDPDAMEIITNTIVGNLSCVNNSPHAQIGDSGGEPNVVGGEKRGECRHL